MDGDWRGSGDRGALGFGVVAMKLARKKRVACATCGRMVKRYAARKDVRCPKCYRAYKRQQAADKIEDTQARQHAWYVAHRGLTIQRSKDWHRNNRVAALKKNQRYRRKLVLLSAEVESYACDCGAPHTPERRQKILRLCPDLSVSEIREAYPCLWAGESGERTLYRDRAFLAGKQSGVAA